MRHLALHGVEEEEEDKKSILFKLTCNYLWFTLFAPGLRDGPDGRGLSKGTAKASNLHQRESP